MFFSTSDICDEHASEIHAGKLNVLRGNWQWFGALRCFGGQIVTLEARGCNSELRAILAEPGEQHVLLIDAGSHTGALLGDNLASLALRNGWAGVVINGNVRDRRALASIEIGILALGTWPEKSNNQNGGKQDVPLVLDGLYINPGDWLYADEDGVLISKRPLLCDKE